MFPSYLMPQPPRENFAQAYDQGAQAAMQQRTMAQALQTDAIRGQVAQQQLAEIEQQQKEQGLLTKAYQDAHGDWDQAMKNAEAAGVRPQTLMPLQQQWTANVSNLARLKNEQLQLENEQNDRIGGALLSQFSTGTDKDTGRPVFRGATNDEWSQFLNDQVSAGNMSAQARDTAMQLHPDGSPPSSDDLQQYSAKLKTASQAISQAQQMQQNADAEKQRQQTLAEGAQKLQQQKILQASQLLSPTDNVGEYDKVYQTLDPNIQKFFPNWASEYDNDEPITDGDRKRIERLGQTPEQQVQSDLTQELRNNTEAHWNAMDAASQQRAAAAAQNAGSNQTRADAYALREANGGQTGNSQAVDRRQAENEFQKLQLQEARLNSQRIQLGNLMKSGKEVTDKDGNPRDLQGEYSQVTDQLAGTLVDKYNAAGRAGRGTPTVSLQDALTAIGRGPNAGNPGASGSRQAPPQQGAPAPRPNTAPANNPPPPNASGAIRVKASDGKTYMFTDEAKAQQFEAAVKSAKGTTQRIQQQ